jgi:plasmid stabilization system protein ParE
VRLIWSPEARRKLIEIRDQLTVDASEAVAMQQIERIRDAARLLMQVPRMGRRVEPERRDDLRVIPVRPRWLYYRIGDAAIEVVTIKHYRQEDALRGE